MTAAALAEARALVEELIAMAEQAADIYQSLSYVRDRARQLGLKPGDDLDCAISGAIIVMDRVTAAGAALQKNTPATGEVRDLGAADSLAAPRGGLVAVIPSELRP